MRTEPTVIVAAEAIAVTIDVATTEVEKETAATADTPGIMKGNKIQRPMPRRPRAIKPQESQSFDLLENKSIKAIH